MSDWDFIATNIAMLPYTPQTSLKTLVTNILLHWEGNSEEHAEEEQITLSAYWDEFVCGDISSFDYE